MVHRSRFSIVAGNALWARLAVFTMVASLAGITGCGDDNNSLTNPAFEPEVNNAADNFQLQATNVESVTQIVDYSWTNTGTAANVDQSCAITTGTGELLIYDSANTLVYTKDLKQGGSDVSATGATGTWKIRVRLINVYGTVNFRVQKNT